MTPSLKMCLEGSKLAQECVAAFDIHRNAKADTRKIAVKSLGTLRDWQAMEIACKVGRVKIPLTVGA